MASEDEQYHPKDAVKASMSAALITGSAGALVSAIQNTLTKRNVSAWGVFTRSGGTIAAFTAVGGTYEFTRNASANLRQRDDSLNSAIGGFLAGSILGLRHGSTAAMVGFGALTAVVLGAFDFTGGSMAGSARDNNVDEFERKQQLRTNRRRPIEETISELGEGRGIYAPGYDERRRERLKEKYGIEIPVKS